MIIWESGYWLHGSFWINLSSFCQRKVNAAVMINMKIKCPVCKKEIIWQGNPFRPFCSERCSLVDLGKWADGKYSVKAEEGKEDRKAENGNEPY